MSLARHAPSRFARRCRPVRGEHRGVSAPTRHPRADDQAFYQRRREEFLAAYEADEERTKASGGNWYRNTARDLGKGYVRRIADAYRRRLIDSYTAVSYLNVKVDQIPRLAQEASLQVSAQR